MILPHYKTLKSSMDLTEPIRSNKFDIDFIKHNSSVNITEFEYIKQNTLKYNLQKNKISIILNFQEESSIIEFCNFFNDLLYVIISVNDKHDEKARLITLKMEDNCLENFSFSQDYRKRCDLVLFSVDLKYKEIESEVFKNNI